MTKHSCDKRWMTMTSWWEERVKGPMAAWYCLDCGEHGLVETR